MGYKPPYLSADKAGTRPAWFILRKAEGYGGVRPACRQMQACLPTKVEANSAPILGRSRLLDWATYFISKYLVLSNYQGFPFQISQCSQSTRLAISVYLLYYALLILYLEHKGCTTYNDKLNFHFQAPL